MNFRGARVLELLVAVASCGVSMDLTRFWLGLTLHLQAHCLEQKNAFWLCSNLENWNFGIFAFFFNADKDLARSSKLEFFDPVGHMVNFWNAFWNKFHLKFQDSSFLEQIPAWLEFWNHEKIVAQGLDKLPKNDTLRSSVSPSRTFSRTGEPLT